MDRFLALALLSLLPACLPTRPRRALPDASTEAPRFSIRVLDSLGEEHPTDALPRRPRIEIDAPIDPDDATTYPVLFRGPYDAALAEDAARAPFTQASLARVIPVRVDFAYGRATIRPTVALELGAVYALVLPGWAHPSGGPAVGTPSGVALRVAPSEAGALLVEAFPPLGSVGLPALVEALDLRFDDAVDARAIALLDARGDLVPSEWSEARCEAVGLDAGVCIRVRPLSSLAPTSVYALDLADVRDRFGDTMSTTRATFTTGDTDSASAPIPTAPTCALDELGLVDACALVADEEVSLRLRFASSARVTATLGPTSACGVTRAGDVSLRFAGLAPETTLHLELHVRSLSGVETVRSAEIRTTRVLPRILVDEIRADAIGPEPAQEYVELWNVAETSIDLGGYRITDGPDREGDALPPGCVLAPNGRALVVADAFDPFAAIDVSPPPGVPLCRIGASIGSSGLTNSGEPILLRDGDGTRVAEAPPIAARGPGRCIVRVAPFARRATSSDYAAIESCSPGVPSP